MNTQETIQKLANATKTYYNCSGHGKAARNERLVNEYKKELSDNNITIPEDEELLKIGVFNGDGAS